MEYTYDAWGKLLSISGSMKDNLGKANPLRYRGYVYDDETGLYYCQSRYYDPEIGRFLNADAFASTGQGLLGNNMFAYCNNNPVRFADYCGTKINHVPIYYEEESIITKWREKGVDFIPNENGNGGQIRNSYLITDASEQYQYALYLKNNTNYFSGSVEAMVFEWYFHNIICNMVDESSLLYERAKDVDLGRTIYDDKHGQMTAIMIFIFRFRYPEQADNDAYMYSQHMGGK